MQLFDSIDRMRHTAIYVRVRTIKDTLNSENVPCLYKSRQNTVNSKRKNKGLEPTVYKRGKRQ